MTNHPKFTESHDSAAPKSSSRTSKGSRKYPGDEIAAQELWAARWKQYPIWKSPWGTAAEDIYKAWKLLHGID